MPVQVQSVERAFAVLHAIARRPGRAGISTIARDVHLPKSTVARLLATMESIGAVERIGDETGYQIGPSIGALASEEVLPVQLATMSRPYLRELVDMTREAAGLTVPDGDDVLYIDQVQAEGPVQVQDWTGQRLAAHTVAAGFVFMAGWDEARLSRHLRSPLEPATDRTLVEAAEIRFRLAEVTRRGYAWTFDEFTEGISGVAAPVRDAEGAVVAAINVYGPTYRFPGDSSVEALGRAVAGAAGRVSALL